MSYTHSVLVTGGTLNLGYHAALIIARQHPEYLVVIASRSDSNKAAESINQTLKQTNVTFLPLDLASLDNVRAFAANWSKAEYPPIKALVLNAGLQFPGPVEYSPDGIEQTFAINQVGHQLLFHLLWPHLTSGARITVTASGTHDPAQKSGMPDALYVSAEELAHPTEQSAAYEGRKRYTTSKLANVLWTYALDRRLKQHASEKHITVNAFDPGLMPGTGLLRDYPAPVRFLWTHLVPRLTWLLRRVYTPNVHSAAESGAALARLAIGNDVEGMSGKYYEGMREIRSSEVSYEVQKQEDLWKWGVKLFAKGDADVEKKYEELK
jgi:NAD(P)-dependent dehydrogenase (short-subunit alcohol dehydrogenase family)